MWGGAGVPAQRYVVHHHSGPMSLVAQTLWQPCGTLRAYADDLAALSPRPALQLPKIAAIFRCIKAASGLTLKPAKCRVVPLAADTDGRDALGRARELIDPLVPEWRDVVVARSGVYLGLENGPGVDEPGQWQEQMAKFEARAMALAGGAMSASRGFAALAQQSLPVLMYVAQFSPPPANLEMLDRRMRTRLAHCPFRAIPDEVLFNPSLVGFRDSPPAQMAAHATLMSTSIRNFQTWCRELDCLLLARSMGGSLAALQRRSVVTFPIEIEGRSPAYYNQSYQYEYE